MIIAIPDDYHRVVHTLDCLSKLDCHTVRIFTQPAPTVDCMLANLRDAEIVVPIRERTRYTRSLIERLPRLKFLSQTGRSFHHIDLASCTERGILVAAGSSDSPHTVAEHTWALILCLLRRISDDAALMKRSAFRETFSLPLHGRTLGVFGLGRIGKLVAATGASFGMRVLVLGRQSSTIAAQAAGYDIACSKEELFEQSDVLCLHLRLTDSTYGIVTERDLARMKSSSLFVNTARAALVAPGALYKALRNGRPGFVAVDVYDSEPVLNGDHALLQMENVLCTPHTAWLEKDTYERYFGEAFDNILDFIEGRYTNIVNPEALTRC
jgi:D-3-phosphoglycerate dehydrogenase / 2-oxoglutarate reductase